MIAAWIIFPLLLALLASGCALLLERVAGLRLPAPLLMPVGLAVIIVAGQLTTATDATSELTAPLVLALAVAGFAVSGRWWVRVSGSAWPWAAALVVFFAYGAPVLLSGDPTLGGYIRLDDTSTWLALTDRVMEHGHSLDGLAPSTYEAALAFNLGDGYPIGVFLPLGIGHVLTGIDSAELVQPYMTLLAASISLSLWVVLKRLIPQRPLRAVTAAIGAQPALLVGYVQWGGVKEVAAAALIALCAALLARVVAGAEPRRWTLPLGFAIAALLSVLSLGGVVWVLPMLLAGAVIIARASGPAAALARSWRLALVTALLSLPLLIGALAGGRLLPPTSSPLTDNAARGNLIEPLGLERALGVWPAGDFRLPAVDGDVAAFLVILVGGAAAVGAGYAVRLRAGAVALYAGGTIVSCLILVAIGSPWVDGKSLAIASPALLTLAMAGAAVAISRGRRLEGGITLLAIVVGVAWSNALAHRDVNLAPYAQLAELREIGEAIAGQGPALLTEYQPFGARHFLREADPEAVSELRRRRVPLRSGEVVPKGDWADTDDLSSEGLAPYRTLVLRRSPVQSRPPPPFELVAGGEYYEVWQRPAAQGFELVEHLPLGGPLDPTAVLGCRDAERLARLVPDGGRLAYAPAVRPVVTVLASGRHPASWPVVEDEKLLPVDDGSVHLRLSVPHAAVWRVWLGGSIRGEMELFVDDARVGSVRHQLNNAGTYVDLGATPLAAGPHTVELRYLGPDLLRPGSGGTPAPIGPLLMTPAPGDGQIGELAPSQFAKLCDRRLDWAAAIR